MFNDITPGDEVHVGNYGNCTNGKLRVIVHGWKDNGVQKDFTHQAYWYEGVKQAYVSLGSNVVAVDWTAYNRMPYFPNSPTLVSHVAEVVAKFVDGWTRFCGISLNQVHLIGHSLGGHIVGLTGKLLYQQKKVK